MYFFACNKLLMRNLGLHFQTLAIKIENFMHFKNKKICNKSLLT